MEMNNSALLQMMSSQNAILEEIRNLRAQDALDKNTPFAPSMPTTFSPENVPLNNGTFSMFQPEQFYDTRMNTAFDSNMANMANMTTPINPNPVAVNPASYAQVAYNPAPPTNPIAPVDPLAFAEGEFQEAFKYDGSRMSNIAREDYVTSRSQRLQLGAVNAAASVGTFAGGASAFLVGGLLPSLAVGGAVAGGVAYAGNQMVEGVKETLNYQEILRRSGYKALNALETTNEFGGIGFSLDDRQDLAKYMRDLAMDEFLSSDEMSSILQGSLDYKLLKSTTDAKSFKEKFKKLVDNVKEVTVIMDQTIDEAVAFMGEMERLGIDTDRSTQISALTKVGASMVGMDSKEFGRVIVDQTNQIVGGTGMDATNVIEGITTNTFTLEAISDVSDKQDGLLKQYIKNNGGVSAVAGDIEATIRSNIQNSSELQKQLMSFAAQAVQVNEYGNLAVDHSQMNEIINSEKSLDQMIAGTAAYTRSLSPNDLARLSSGFGTALNNTMNQGELYALVNRLKDEMSTMTGMDGVTAVQQLGLAQDAESAQLINQMLMLASNEDVQRQVDAKMYKEMTDAANIADSPGLGKRLSFWFKNTIGSPLANPGIYLSDEIGDISQSIQMRLKGIEETGIVGGDLQYEFDENYMENVFYGENSLVNRNVDVVNSFESLDQNPELSHLELETGYRYFKPSVKVQRNQQPELEALTNERFNYLVDAAKAGELNGAQIQEIQEKLQSGNLHKSSVQQYEYILKTLQGEYDGDGFWDTITKKDRQLVNYLGASLHWGPWRDTGGGKPLAGSDFDTLEAIEDEEEALTKKAKKLEASLNKSILKSGYSGDVATEIQRTIREGDVVRLSELTNDEALIGVGSDYSEYIDQIKKLNLYKDDYFEIYDSTLTLAKSTDSSLSYLKTSGIFTEEEFSSYFGGISKDVVEITEEIKEGKMNHQELAEVSEKLFDAGDVYKYLSASKQQEIALSMAETFGLNNIDFLFKEGTNTIDAEKMHQYLLGIGRDGHSGKNVAENLIDGNLSGAMDDHKTALNEVLDTFVEEVDSMYEAIGAIRNTPGKKYTSVTTNSW